MSKIAIFFDAENVSASKMPGIISFLSKKGDIIFQRAYADWSVESTKSWKTQLSEMPIVAIQQFHHSQEQAVDKAIMMDAIEMAIKHDDIGIFVLVASDNGYYSLALRLRELGRHVIGIGDKRKCKAIWVKSCNEFSYFEDLEETDGNLLLQSDESDEQPDFSDLKNFSLEKFLEHAFDLTPPYKDTDTVVLANMWASVLNQKSDFNVKKYGFKTPREMVESAEIFNVFVSEDKKTVFVEKRARRQKADGERRTGIIKRRIYNYCIITADDKSGDYFFYMKEMNAGFKDVTLEKGMRVDFLVVKEPDSGALLLRDRNGNATDVKILGDGE